MNTILDYYGWMDKVLINNLKFTKYKYLWEVCSAGRNLLVSMGSFILLDLTTYTFYSTYLSQPKNRANNRTCTTTNSKTSPIFFFNLQCKVEATKTDGKDESVESTFIKTEVDDRINNRRVSSTSFVCLLPLGTIVSVHKKVSRNMVTKSFTLIRNIHSLCRAQTKSIHDKICTAYSQFLHLVLNESSSLTLVKTPRILPKRTFISEMFLFGLLCLSFDTARGIKQSGFGCKSVTAGQVCLPKEYSKYELPNPSGVNPIGVELLIQEVLRINDKDYSITFSCYYNIRWPDPRLQLSQDFGREVSKTILAKHPDYNITMNPDVTVPINLEMIKDLWLPNILIYNLKTFKVMDVLSKLAGLWISADYKILYSTATHITFICPMHFDKFPLDTQSCKFQVGSYSYDDSQMTFKTEKAGYDSKTQNSIALDYAIEIRPLSQEDSVLQFDGLGNFSLAGFELVLDRYVSTYIITYYLPSGLFVIVSWISFLIPMDVIPGRMALLVTLFLVLVNIFNNVTTNTPKAEGLTAIEAWMLACILFVFGALIE